MSCSGLWRIQQRKLICIKEGSEECPCEMATVCGIYKTQELPADAKPRILSPESPSGKRQDVGPRESGLYSLSFSPSNHRDPTPTNNGGT